MASLNLYKTYSFKTKDPVIDELRTIIQYEGLTYTEINKLSNVTVATLHGWFHGKTRRPQSATIEAVGRACGYHRAWKKLK